MLYHRVPAKTPAPETLECESRQPGGKESGKLIWKIIRLFYIHCNSGRKQIIMCFVTGAWGLVCGLVLQ